MLRLKLAFEGEQVTSEQKGEGYAPVALVHQHFYFSCRSLGSASLLSATVSISVAKKREFNSTKQFQVR
jgi:hypothetical protein